jgi:hypothetical protein
LRGVVGQAVARATGIKKVPPGVFLVVALGSLQMRMGLRSVTPPESRQALGWQLIKAFEETE